MKFEQGSNDVMINVSDISCPHCGNGVASKQVNRTNAPTIVQCSQETGSCGRYFAIRVKQVLEIDIAKLEEFKPDG